MFFGRAGSQECVEALQVALRVCSEVGMPVAVHKTEGPSTSLGILIDTVKMEIRLPSWTTAAELVRPSVVVVVSGRLEWHSKLRPDVSLTSDVSGSWAFTGVVSVYLASLLVRDSYHSEGSLANCDGLRYVGRTVVL